MMMDVMEKVVTGSHDYFARFSLWLEFICMYCRLTINDGGQILTV